MSFSLNPDSLKGAYMDTKYEIIKKYRLFLKAKQMTVILGTVSALCLFGFFLTQKYNLKLISALLLIFSVLSLVIFLIFCAAMRPMRKHILSLIQECQK